MRTRRAAVTATLSVLIAAVALFPVQALAATAGSGVVTGIVSFAPPGVPASVTSCASTSFTFSGTAQLAVASQAAGEYVGSVGVTGGGGSGCENVSFALGSVSVSVIGYANIVGWQLSCAALGANYIRVGPNVLLIGSAGCTINGVSPPGVQLAIDGEFVPSSAGQGVTGPVTSAVFAAGFAIIG